MKTDLETAVEAVVEAGKPLAEAFGKIAVLGSKNGKETDLVTQLDIDTEAFIEKKLKEHDPSIGFAGEESGARKGEGRYWLLDPIDGTAHFVRGIPFCTTMLALVEDGQVVLSVIYNFVTKELFTAEKGKGAFLNGAPIHVSDRPLSHSFMSVEMNLKNEEIIPKFLVLREKTVMVHTINCGYEFGLVAQGKLEGRLCLKPYGYDWDYAPGSLLVTEAGGVVANISKDTYDFTDHDFIAANKQTYDDLTKGPDAIFPIR